jgi:hypothetical protein
MGRALGSSSLLLLVACSGGGSSSVSSDSSLPATTSTTGEASAGGTTTTTTATSTGTSTGAPTTTAAASTSGEEEVAGLELLPRLAGLWTGSAMMTPLGTIPLMNMDVRAASGQVLFSRADFDASNSLRFAFGVEEHGSGPALVYRNGGYFLGLLRDSRARLVEHTGESWRFCSVDRGCEYIDARFTLAAEDRLILDVKVKENQHLYWDATRVETRPLPEPFPAEPTPLAKDAPFPPMPSLRVDVSWAEPLAQDGAVWALVTTTPCDLQLQCKHSRSLRTAVPAGATSASLVIEQIHAGSYQLTAVLDRNGNIAETLLPDAGDGLSLPNQAVAVAPSGETTAKATIVIDL